MPEAGVARSGLGFDVHRFADGRELWLGGVRFDHAGLAGKRPSVVRFRANAGGRDRRAHAP